MRKSAIVKGENDVIKVSYDRKKQGLSRELSKDLHGESRRDHSRPSAPALWSAKPASNFELPHTWGAYPKGFITWACKLMGCHRQYVFHLCAGSVPVGEGALRVDIRPETHPDLLADCRHLPLADGIARAVMIDPPYAVEYAEDLYNTAYPRPAHLLAEAARISMPGAPIGFLHFLLPRPPEGATIERTYGVTTGPNYRIRAFTVFRKTQPRLL